VGSNLLTIKPRQQHLLVRGKVPLKCLIGLKPAPGACAGLQPSRN
jgi:hypothetical protein